MLSRSPSATVAALVKASYLPSYGKTGDWLWDSQNLTIWTVVESNVGIIAGNLPCLKPLFRVVLGGTYGHGSRKTPVPAYGYQSRSYGAGTTQKSVDAKGWRTLVSDRTADGDLDSPYPYGGKESYLLTTINAKRDFNIKPGDMSASGEIVEGMGKDSVECLTRSGASRGLGGIKVDTEVNVVKSHGYLDLEPEGADRKEKKDMV